MSKKIFILGVNSYIGSHLKCRLEAEGHEVFASTRREADVNSKTIFFDFNSPSFKSEVFKGIDWLVYCAHDVAFNDLETMTHAITHVYEASSSAGVKNHIFPSTAGITEGIESDYIASKKIFEDFFIQRGGYVLRLGLVWGNGGIAKKIRNITLKLPFSVLIGGGQVRFAMIGLDDLLRIFSQIIEKRPNIQSPVHIFYAQRFSLKQIIAGICRIYGKRFYSLSIPLWPFLTAAKLAEAVRIRLPFSSASLQRLTQNVNETERSDLAVFQIREQRDLDQIIDQNR